MDYLGNLKEIRFRVNQEDYEQYKKAARNAGYESMRQFYIESLNEKVNKLNEDSGENEYGKIRSRPGNQ